MNIVRLSWRRLLHAVDNHGVFGTLQRAFRRVRPAAGSGASDNRAEQSKQHPFDRLHGVDTSGYVPGELLEAPGGSASDLYNTAYYGISPSTLSAALRQLPIDPERFAFVDLGCGKGRALLVAAALPFREVIGVELDPALSRVAAANAAASGTAGGRIHVLNGDAVTMVYPRMPVVVYLYHPFLVPVLRRVLRSIEQQFCDGSRECYILFANPIYVDVIRRFRFLEEIWDYDFSLSAEDAEADRHGITSERYTLYKATR